MARGWISFGLLVLVGYGGYRVYQYRFRKEGEGKPVKNVPSRPVPPVARDGDSPDAAPEDSAQARERVVRKDREQRTGEARAALEKAEAIPPLPRGTIEDQLRAWELLSLAYMGLSDPALRNRARDRIREIVGCYVLSKDFYDSFVPSIQVKRGDTLTGIARAHGTTVECLRRLNVIEGDEIYPGNRLKVLGGTLRIFIRKAEYRMWVTHNDRVLAEFPVGIGKRNATPSGRFVVGVRQKDPIWYRPGGAPVPPGDPENVLGSRWLGFKDTEEHSGIGIHGTNDESTVGIPSSRGCIRMRQEDVELLYDITPLGTEVVILE